MRGTKIATSAIIIPPTDNFCSKNIIPHMTRVENIDIDINCPILKKRLLVPLYINTSMIIGITKNGVNI